MAPRWRSIITPFTDTSKYHISLFIFLTYMFSMTYIYIFIHMLFFILQYIVYMLTYLLSGLYIPICIFLFCLAEFPRSPRRALRRDDRLLRPVVWRPRFPKKSCGKLHPNWGLHWMVNGWIKLVYIGLSKEV
jgi:hypothetical protein